MKLSKKMIKALEDTVWAYEVAIEMIQNKQYAKFIEAWHRYGKHDSCNLCKAIENPNTCYGIWNVTPDGCDKCPLWEDGINPKPCVEDTFMNMKLHCRSEPIYRGNGKLALSALKARLKWIHKRVGENGWEVV